MASCLAYISRFLFFVSVSLQAYSLASYPANTKIVFMDCLPGSVLQLRLGFTSFSTTRIYSGNLLFGRVTSLVS